MKEFFFNILYKYGISLFASTWSLIRLDAEFLRSFHGLVTAIAGKKTPGTALAVSKSSDQTRFTVLIRTENG